MTRSKGPHVRLEPWAAAARKKPLAMECALYHYWKVVFSFVVSQYSPKKKSSYGKTACIWFGKMPFFFFLAIQGGLLKVYLAKEVGEFEGLNTLTLQFISNIRQVR